MKANERLDLAAQWADSIRKARSAEQASRAARKRADALAARFELSKWPKRGLIVPAGLIVIDSQQTVPSWRTIAEAYISPELIAEEIAALPSVPKLVLVASQPS
jgi:hypothetical protein